MKQQAGSVLTRRVGVIYLQPWRPVSNSSHPIVLDSRQSMLRKLLWVLLDWTFYVTCRGSAFDQVNG